MGGRIVSVSALQFACTDDVSTNVDTAERSFFFSSIFHSLHNISLSFVLSIIFLGFHFTKIDDWC